ncbi:MAG: IS66 family insertion sequence element accessory protein TnpB [Proteobacteria bacterium]|nr:IS66 family insertion sequence element accessory protein TnpB [Pseudomonadota bacterium]MBS0555275.1 IS66 family insertion sequence element accessory protein TnpB [Pseudomonadota bacterium]
MIRIEALWLSAAPLDMRAGMDIDTLLAQVVRVFGQAQPHHAYLFSNRRGTRLKVLVHDGFGVWLACRRLNQGPGVRHFAPIFAPFRKVPPAPARV